MSDHQQRAPEQVRVTSTYTAPACRLAGTGEALGGLMLCLVVFRP